MANGRSNAKTRVTFTTADGNVVAETVHGGGFGAFSKMVDRATTAVTGWTPAEARVGFAGETVTFTHRTTGETVAARFQEV